MARLPDPRFATDCHIVVDGRRVPARGGESVASALLADGRPLIARSPKYHRPRGAFCLAGSCGSCLARIGGMPNQRACRFPCSDGLSVETQNAVPNAAHDVLGVVDRIYARGLDHHTLMTWSRVANRAAVRVSRLLAGLGKLPDAPPARSGGALAEERFDAVVVGAGPAGLAAAEVLSAAGRRVLLADEERTAGGRLRCRMALPGDPPPSWIADACASVRRAGGEVALDTAVVGRWEHAGPILAILSGPPGRRLRLVRAARLVVATGTYAEPPEFADGDLPGIVAARGLLAALAEHGVVAGERAAIVGDGVEARAVADSLAAAGIAVVTRAAAPRAARGSARVGELVLEGGERIACDLVAVATRRAPALELLRSAGAPVVVGSRSGRVRLAARGPEVAPGVYAAGEVLRPMTAADALASGRSAGEAAVG